MNIPPFDTSGPKKVRIKDPKSSTPGDGRPTKGAPRAKRRSKKQREADAEKNKILLKINTKKLMEDELDVDFVPEEHVIFRVPSDLAPKLKELVEKREPLEGVQLEFQEDRKGTFTFANQTYSTRLVDLPCVIESHKSIDSKNLYKISDISQMLVIQDAGNAPSKPMDPNDPFTWPDGLTPPLKNVRNRRFRQRTTKQIGETVEAELEKLLEEDLNAIDVVYDLHDGIDYDSDNESTIARSVRDELESHVDMDDPSDIQFLDDDYYRTNLRSDTNIPSGDDTEVVLSDAQSSIRNQDEDEDDDDDDDDTSEDDEDEDDEDAMEKARLRETIANMEKDIEKKVQELTRITNPIIRKRFEDTIGKQRVLMAEYQEQLDAFAQK